MPAVSLVVPTFRGAQRLPRLLRALEAQSERDFEVVVVVDGVVDDSEAVVARPWDLRVRPLVLPHNRGRATALNAGLRAATGDVLVRCDDDFDPPATHVASHLAAHSGDARGVVGVCRNVLADSPYARCYGWDAEQRSARAAYSAAPSRTWVHWGGNVSVTRETWERVGPYDAETFRGYGWEDVDWGYRLHRSGVPVVVDPAVEVEHHVAADDTVARAVRALHAGAARSRFDAKHPEVAAAEAVGGGAWTRLVHAVARGLDERRARHAGAAVERLLPHVPRPVATKLVALLVESAGEAGRHHPERIGHAF